jgi:hypothetical protein
MRSLRRRSWSPWVVGAGIGVLSWFAFLTAKHGLGITSPFEHTAALVERALAPRYASSTGYFAGHEPKIGWEWMLVVGVFLGSMISSRLSGDREAIRVPSTWQARFGASVPTRMAWAFAGGAVMMLGARVAMGCTSGHGITGVLQLALSSVVFIGVAFAIAAGTASLMFGRKGQSHV